MKKNGSHSRVPLAGGVRQPEGNYIAKKSSEMSKMLRACTKPHTIWFFQEMCRRIIILFTPVMMSSS